MNRFISIPGILFVAVMVPGISMYGVPVNNVLCSSGLSWLLWQVLYSLPALCGWEPGGSPKVPITKKR